MGVRRAQSWSFKQSAQALPSLFPTLTQLGINDFLRFLAVLTFQSMEPPTSPSFSKCTLSASSYSPFFIAFSLLTKCCRFAGKPQITMTPKQQTLLLSVSMPSVPLHPHLRAHLPAATALQLAWQWSVGFPMPLWF